MIKSYTLLFLASDGTEKLKLYWAKASTALGWPSPWDGSANTPGNPDMGNPVGTQFISSIETDEETILEFAWYPPDPADYSSITNDPFHFCLLARIETSATSPFGMTYTEGAGLMANVKNNNNIVWRNISVIDSLPGGGLSGPPPHGNPVEVACAQVQNLSITNEKEIQLEFIVPEIEQSHTIFEYVNVEVDLGETLTQRWIEGGSEGSGIEFENELFTVLEPNAYIGNFLMTAEESEIVCINFQQKEEPPENITNTFHLDMVQYDEGALVGGERFRVIVVREEPEAALRKKYQPDEVLMETTTETILVYPNPSRNQFTIVSNSDESQEVVLFDITGRHVLQKSFLDKTVINVSSLDNGVYILKSKNNSSKTPFLQKIIVQH